MSAKEIINEIVGMDNKISDLMDRFEDLPIGSGSPPCPRFATRP